jgi:hypothetical protein
LLFFGRQRFLIARPLVHKGPVLSAELLPHPLRAGARGRRGEGPGAGSALRRLVAVEPFIGMSLADDSGVVGHSLIDCAALSHQLPFFLCEGLQCSTALLTAESAWPLQIACMHRSTHASHSTQRSTRAAHTQKFSLGHAQLQKSKRCNRNGEICSRSVHHQ